MTFLVAIWTSSLLLLLAVVALAFYRMRRGAPALAQVSHDLDEFVREELTRALRLAWVIVATAKPHTKRLGSFVLEQGRYGRDVFSERVFGRVQSVRGNTGSFFLKYIAEHKEAVRKESGGKIGY